MSLLVKSMHELMIVEDDFDDRYLLKSVLERLEEPFTISEFDNGQSAYRNLAERLSDSVRLPDLILLDLNMPVFDGFSFLERVRSVLELRVVPIVVYTTSSAEVDIVKSYQLGANAYMVKPLSFREVKSMLESTIDYWINVADTVVTLTSGEDAMNFGVQRG